MRIELVPGTTNVMRFPVERRARPTLGLLREIAPDERVVLSLAAAFGLDAPAHDLRELVDEATAQHVLDQFGGVGPVPRAALDALLDAVMARAVGACRAAGDLSLDLADAQLELGRAQAAGHLWADPLRDRVEALALRTAEALIEALTRVEEAEGVARAVGLARRGEAWTPRDHRADEAALFGPAILRAG